MRVALLVAPFLAVSLLLDACDTGSPAAPRAAVPPSGPSAVAPLEDAGPDATVPKGARSLGVGTDRTSEAYYAGLLQMRDAGASLTTVEVAWDEVERPVDAGTEDAAPTLVSDFTLHGPAIILADLRGRAVLELDVTDDRGRRAPEDLGSVALDDPALVARFVRAQDYVLGATGEMPLAGYVIGSRVDVAQPGSLAAFASFFTQAAAAARAKRPGVLVGFSVSPAALSSRAAELASSWAASDFVATRLDPVLPSDGGLPSPAVAADAIARAATAAPGGKPLFVLGAAYPSGADAGSDEAMQAAFVGEAFAAWDRNATRVPVLVFTQLDDRSSVSAARAADRAGRTDRAAIEALRSIGLRDEVGTPKPAWNALVGQARARGF